ncbi:MAG: DUF6778 family protein [Pseudomonadota bacterium]
MNRRNILLGGTAALLAGCGRWEVDYSEGLDPAITKNWTLHGVNFTVPEDLTVSNDNTLAPSAEIVWHGEPLGDRKAQVARIMEDGIRQGGSVLPGTQHVTIVSRLKHFHAVTPAAVARSPAAVHNIAYRIQVFDSRTAEPLTEAQNIQADLEAFVGQSAVVAELQGQGQRFRIVNHVARVTAGWLGVGDDQRREFSSIGR